MNRIITIGREFGSGGRELGKRLSELLGYAYYDKEIVEEIAKRTQLAESYVQQIVEQKHNFVFPINVGRTLHPSLSSDCALKQLAAVYAEQANVLREMSEKSSCIIVGRCADYILREKSPSLLDSASVAHGSSLIWVAIICKKRRVFSSSSRETSCES